MQEDPEERIAADRMLKRIEELYGFVPLVNEVLSERPDMFIPAVRLGKAVLEGKGDLDRRTRYLAAVAAATAVGGEHCIKVQMEHAIKAGATKDELMETMMIGSYMAMTRSQSYAFRRLSERFPDE
ncbi:MAG: carboxymuconolactone decarboxylase family protein [Candidatus Methanomethylophilaceae archaeon]|jgi:AhpD family alkylhydroperoxidase|nr:carboxymuconolactone decarboxylase family protein [Candidatus Methanomethylophilaceae archaeon]NLF33639.1 carboxymuconolactone decarboxylase family protein [Thermoplasmatales archaeon]